MVLPKHTINPLSIFTSGYWNNQRSHSPISPWKQLKFNDIRNKLKSIPQLSSGEKLNKATQSVYTFLKANRDNLKYSSQETYGGTNEKGESTWDTRVTADQLYSDYKKFHTTGYKRGFTLPFSPNTGPGNDLHPPTNTADEHSLTHDIAYGKGGDVSGADKEFINAQSDHALEDPIGSISQVTGLLGTAGIMLKQGLEKKIGQLYPKLPGND